MITVVEEHFLTASDRKCVSAAVPAFCVFSNVNGVKGNDGDGGASAAAGLESSDGPIR